ncbi:hypothetical protein D3C78_1246300 [compost metagenome]
MLILAGRQQLARYRLILLRLAATLGRAGQRMGEDGAPTDPQQQFGAGTEQATPLPQRQREVEGVGVLGHQARQHLLGIGGLAQLQLELARQHHLGEPPLGEGIQRGADRGLELGGGRRAVGRDHLVGHGGHRLGRAALPSLIAAGDIETGGFGRIEGEGTDQQRVGLACVLCDGQGLDYLPLEQGPFTGGGADGLTQVIGAKGALTRGKQEIGRRSRLDGRGLGHHKSIHFTPSKKIQNDNDYQFAFVRR